MSAKIAPSSVFAVLLVGATVLGSGCGKESSAVSTALPVAEQMAGPVLGEVAKHVPGLSQVEAALGAGSTLALAQDKMPANQFTTLSSKIPGANQLITDATSKGLPRPLNSLQDVTSFLGKNGFTTEQINAFVPAFSKEVSKLVPADVASAFTAALK